MRIVRNSVGNFDADYAACGATADDQRTWNRCRQDHLTDGGDAD